jgi:hypothetical protein
LDPTKFLSRLDAVLEEISYNKTGYGERFQRSLERTCAVELKKIFSPREKRNINYWWNQELSSLRAATLKKKRLAQRLVRIKYDYAGQLVTAYKDFRRMLKAEINRSKDKA